MYHVFVTCLRGKKKKKDLVFVFFQIRRQMIDGRPGDMQIKTLIKSIDEASSTLVEEFTNTSLTSSLTRPT